MASTNQQTITQGRRGRQNRDDEPWPSSRRRGWSSGSSSGYLLAAAADLGRDGGIDGSVFWFIEAWHWGKRKTLAWWTAEICRCGEFEADLGSVLQTDRTGRPYGPLGKIWGPRLCGGCILSFILLFQREIKDKAFAFCNLLAWFFRTVLNMNLVKKG
jgi:hypothetical protein